MIDPNKLPTAAVYWQYLAHAPVIVTVDSIKPGAVYTRQRGHVEAQTIYEIDMFESCMQMYEAYKALRSSFLVLKSTAI